MYNYTAFSTPAIKFENKTNSTTLLTRSLFIHTKNTQILKYSYDVITASQNAKHDAKLPFITRLKLFCIKLAV